MLLMILASMVALAPATTSPLRPVERPDREALPGIARSDCPEARAYYASKSPGTAVARRLDQLPPGRLELTVLREVDGCPIPAVLREGITPANPSGVAPSRR